TEKRRDLGVTCLSHGGEAILTVVLVCSISHVNTCLFHFQCFILISCNVSAITDYQVWKDATERNNAIYERSQHTLQYPIADILQQQTHNYCIVDASWKSPTEKAGIGWSLFSKEGISWLQGSSAIAPTNSPFIAEAMAMLLAVQQLHTLAYKNVFIFHYVPRNQVHVVDQLAKRARITNQNYVISWMNC
ncbi:hypothetical protein HID58_018811, partial [Brassica napus]